MGKTAVIYCRTSTAGQKQEETIRAQRAVTARLAKLHGVEVIAKLEDDGVSGALLAGRAFAKFVDDLESGKVRPDFLIVASTSRLSREDTFSTDPKKQIQSAVDAARINSVLRVRGVKVIDSEGTHADLRQAALEDSHERDKIRRRTMNGKATRLARGSLCLGGLVPYGYERTGAKRAGWKWIPHPVNADRLRKILGWYVEGGCTYAARMATEEGDWKTPKHNMKWQKRAGWGPHEWISHTVEGFAKHASRYLGSMTLELDGEPYEITYPPLIDSRMFAAIQRRKKERTLKHRATFLSTGFVDCTCGGHVVMTCSGGGSEKSWHQARCRKCRAGSMKEAEFTWAVWDATVSRLVQIRESERESSGKDPYGAALTLAKTKLADVKARVVRLAEMRENDELDRETWRARNAALTSQLTLARGEVDRLTREQKDREAKAVQEQSTADRVDALLDELELERDSLSLDRKRAVLSDLLQGSRVLVAWTPDGLRLTFPAFGSLAPMIRDVKRGKGWVRDFGL